MLKYVDEFRDIDIVMEISSRIKGLSTKPLNIMEVCGGHTMSIRKNGIHKLVGDNIKLLSGPGCPVCVTSAEDMDKVIFLARMPQTIICTFGDMLYVPGTSSSLSEEKAAGAAIKTIYSVQDALRIAKENPGKKIIFISIGFETTTPTIAAAIIEAETKKINNFSVLALNKTMPAALDAVLKDENSKINALICPGHVTTITGIDMYAPIVADVKVSCCVSGFEPVDILNAIYKLTELFENGQIDLINAYERVVKPEGNIKAQSIMAEVFEKCDASWRGFGVIPGSGLKINEKYKSFDVEEMFDIKVQSSFENKNCICGDILRGAKTPDECILFKTKCTPEAPKGACMVSSEGACAAWYKYRD